MIREQRQEEAVNSYDGNERGVIMAAPRFGKIKVAISIINKIRPKNVLIVYPRVDIEMGWRSDFQKWKCSVDDIVYCTYRSLEKMSKEDWGMIILDEIHEASVNELRKVNMLKTDNMLGLTGTATITTLNQIYLYTKMSPCYEYTIETAVKEGILCDYDIIIHHIELKGSEKQKSSHLEYVYNRLKKEKKNNTFIYLKQIQLFQKSITKRDKTRELLEEWKDERVLVFCGLTEIADSLGCPVYHSKSKEKKIFDDFCNGTGNHLATIRMAQAGITVKPINKGLINYTSGSPEDTAQKICRFLGLEYDNPGKRAEIHIVCSTEKFEKDRLSSSLQFFDEKKIIKK